MITQRVDAVDSLSIKPISLSALLPTKIELDTTTTLLNVATLLSTSTMDSLRNEIKKNEDNKRLPKNQTSAAIAKLKKTEADLRSALAKAKKEFDKVSQKNQKVIDSLKYANYKLKDQQTKLILESNRRELKILSYTINKQKSIVDKMSDLLNKQPWRERGKTLNDEDDSLQLIAYGKLTASLENSKIKYTQLQPLIDNATEKLNTLIKQEQQFADVIDVGLLPVLFDTLASRNKRLDDALVNYNSSIALLGTQLTESAKSLETHQKEYAEGEKTMKAIFAKYKLQEKQDEGDIKAIANFTQPLANEGKLVPEITVLAFKQDNQKDKFLSYNLKLFVAASENKSTLNSEYRFFIPEASTYGFMSDFSLGFLPVAGKESIKRMGINIGAYYLGKSIVREKDSSTFNVGLLQFKAGMQYVLIKNVMSIYANLNPYFVANGNKNFKDVYTGYSNKLNLYTDFGLECYLDLAKKQDGFYLNFDLGFITKGGDVKTILNTEDALIPRIKLGLVKAFSF